MSRDAANDRARPVQNASAQPFARIHPGAIHVVAHVMEMQGRARDGLAFLAATEWAWVEGTGFSVHLAWHRALFYLDAADPESALANARASAKAANDAAGDGLKEASLHAGA
jgi:hypothetical protein